LTAAVVAGKEQVVPAFAIDYPWSLDQPAVIGGIVRLFHRDERNWRAVGGERHSVGCEFPNFDRSESRAPVQQSLTGLRIIEQHRIDVFEALAAKQRLAPVGKWPFRSISRSDREAKAPSRIGQCGVRFRRVVKGIAFPIPRNMRSPEILCLARPIGFDRERITKMLPFAKVCIDSHPRIGEHFA